jgi:hypothetical protein
LLLQAARRTQGEVKPDSDASTWDIRLTNSARDNYGKACDDQQGSGNPFVNSPSPPFFLSRLVHSLQRTNFQNKIFIFHFAINLTL